MSDVPHSNESPGRRATRLAMGTTIGFLISQLAPWPAAHLLPVVVVALLMDASPLTFHQGLKVFLSATFFFLSGGVVAWLLTPWPVILVLACGFILYRMAHFMLTTDAHLLVIISALIGFIVIPILVVLLPAVGFIAATGFIFDWGVALPVVWFSWLVMRPNASLPDHHEAEAITPEMGRELAWTLTLILTPLMVTFLVFSWTKILVVVYAAIFATSFSSLGGRQTGIQYFVANAVYGCIGMLICYELLVMIPDVTFMVPIVFVAVFIFGYRIFIDGPTSAFWNSGIFGFLIMLGGILMKDDVVAASTLIERLWQLVLATAYVTFAFSFLQLYRHLTSQKKPDDVTSLDSGPESDGEHSSNNKVA